MGLRRFDKHREIHTKQRLHHKQGQSSCKPGAWLSVLFWILKGIVIVAALAFAYKIYTFIKLYKNGHLNKHMLSQKCGLLKTFIAFVAFRKVGEAVDKKKEPLLASGSLDLTSVQMSNGPRRSVCEILDDAN